MKYLILILFFGVFACKCPINEQYLILNWTKNLDSITKLRTELRLSFGKTIANALGNKKFRDYIKKISENLSDSSFKEILFSVHQNDLVDGSNSFKQIIKKYVDCEVKTLFGDSLVEKTLLYDPCVCLKIPDFLFDLNWNTVDFAPCVYVQTLNSLDGYQDYMVYHFSGYQNLIKDYEYTKPEHYYIMVKYSEDYSLVNTDTWKNEKGISFFEFLPQVQSNWPDLQSLILDKSITTMYGSNFVFIAKYEAYKVWSQKYSYHGTLLSQSPGCGEQCLRDCAKQDDFVPTTLDYVQVTNPLFYQEPGTLFNESTTLIFGFWNSGLGSFENLFAIPSIRFKKLGFKPKSIYLKNIYNNYENLGYIQVPYIDFQYDQDKKSGNKINVNYEITSKLKLPYFQFLVGSFTYKDIIKNCNLEYTQPYEIHASNCPIQGVDIISYCEPALIRHSPSFIACYFNY
ncbi:MAG TPA: hypothetical protein VK590_08060 [Saprospiraceae bacterium]|nr:hypothetical protein [Saprospiraceae bacterium]